MKHIILFSVFSILGIASLLGLALIPKEKISNPTSKTLSLASTTQTEEKPIISNEDIPLHQWIKTATDGSSITFEHLTYTLENSRVNVTCEEPEVV